MFAITELKFRRVTRSIKLYTQGDQSGLAYDLIKDLYFEEIQAAAEIFDKVNQVCQTAGADENEAIGTIIERAAHAGDERAKALVAGGVLEWIT